jgi:hypothetical protein
MANKTSLPTKAELDVLIELLAATADEPDDVSSSRQPETNSDVTNLAEDLVKRLERGIEEMRASSEDVPEALSNTVQLLHAHIDQETRDITTEEWVDSLLSGRVPPGRGQSTGHAPTFRSLRMDLLTEDDLEILKEMAEEIRRQKES